MRSKVVVADVFQKPEYAQWARTPARLCTSEDRALVSEIAELMEEARQENDWTGVSHQNIYTPFISCPFIISAQ